MQTGLLTSMTTDCWVDLCITHLPSDVTVSLGGSKFIASSFFIRIIAKFFSLMITLLYLDLYKGAPVY